MIIEERLGIHELATLTLALAFGFGGGGGSVELCSCERIRGFGKLVGGLSTTPQAHVQPGQFHALRELFKKKEQKEKNTNKKQVRITN